MKKFIIDRIEEDSVVLECENGTFVTLERKALPKKIKDGDALYFNEGSYFLDAAETERRKQKMADLMKDLFTE